MILVSPVSLELIAELPDKRAALRACALYSGKPLKQIASEVGINDPGHLSKMLNFHADPRHFPPEKEIIFMQVCGNHIPLLWTMQRMGYPFPGDLVRLQEENRKLREEKAALEAEVAGLRQQEKQVVNIFKTLEVR